MDDLRIKQRRALGFGNQPIQHEGVWFQKRDTDSVIVRYDDESKSWVEWDPDVPGPVPPAGIIGGGSGNKYSSLSAIAGFLTVLGWITVIGGGFFTIAAAANLSDFGGGGQVLTTLVFGLMASVGYGVTLIAAAQLIYLLIDVQDNTARTAVALEQAGGVLR